MAKKIASKYLNSKKNKSNGHIQNICISDLLLELEKNNVSPNDTILIHSSFTKLGRFRERPNKIIQELKLWLNDNGTLLFPAFTMQSTQYKELNQNNIFDLTKLKITTGVLPGFAAKDKDFIRSLHPTHSVVAFGKNAESFLSEHGDDGTTTGVKSPFYKLMMSKGKIINLGVGLNQTTSVHMIEELTDFKFPISSVLDEIFEVKVSYNDMTKNLLLKSLRPELHYVRNVDKIKPYLINNGALKEIEFGSGIIQIIDSQLLYKSLKDLSMKGCTIYGKLF